MSAGGTAIAMAEVNANINQSHYNTIVKYCVYKLITAQRNILREHRATSVNMYGWIDNDETSSVTPEDILKGWQPRTIKR